jgi:DNA-binding transcriptional LysR family regulator
MDAAHIKSFLALMKTSGFSRAAQLVHRSQPTVSRHIKELEEHFDTRLFQRFGPMAVKPTPDARLLKDMLSPLLADLESAKDRFDQAKGREAPAVIRLATHESVITYFLPPVIRSFKTKHPDVHLTILRRTRPEIVALVLDGEVDFGITSLDAVPRGVRYEVIGRFRRVLIAPKDHPLSRIRKVTLRDMAKYPLIMPPKESRTRRLLDEVFQKAGLEPNLSIEMMGRDAVKTYVLMGFGISIMSEYFILPSDKKEIASINIDHIFGTTERAVIARKGRKFSIEDNAFLDEMRLTILSR